MNLDKINTLSLDEAKSELHRCCGSDRWVEEILKKRPFTQIQELTEAADQVWFELTKEDWLEAFSHHPKIGNKDKLRERFSATADWAQEEQAGSKEATDATLEQLAEANEEYFKKFGYIFIVCATGKSAVEMLEILMLRLGNSPEVELKVAAKEQSKITKIRLEKLQ